VTSIEPENQDGDVVADSFVIKDIAEFLAPLDEALFSDFLELASYLNSEGYKDAAAVICGGVLEGHLRKLSEKLGIAVVAENGLPNQGRCSEPRAGGKGRILEDR
jgi:hypothetical protein